MKKNAISKPSYNKLFLGICVLLAATTFSVYFQVRNFDFINFDDNVYIYENQNIQQSITSHTFKWLFNIGYASNWHPLTWISHLIDWQLFGGNAGRHHLVSVLFHIANTILLFCFFKKTTSLIWSAFFIAVFFAIHPLHIESVAWVAERKDVLSTFFWLLTMLAYVNYANKQKLKWYFITLILFILGLMSKPMLVTLPFVLLLLDYWPLERKFSKTLLLEKIPMLLISGVSCVMTYIAQQKSGAVYALKELGVKERLFNAAASYAKYIGKMFWPKDLTVFYPYSVDSEYKIIGAAVFLVVVTLFVVLRAGKNKYLFTGWFWYLGTLVPVIGLVQVGGQAMADRYTYFTLTGLFIMVVFGGAELAKKLKLSEKIIASAAALIVTVLAISTFFQLQYWQNSFTLFERALAINQDNALARLHIAKAYCDIGQNERGIEEYRKYLQMEPADAAVNRDFAMVLSRSGKYDEAAEEFKKYLEMRPDDVNALNDLGVALSRTGRNEEAERYFVKALDLKPDFVAAHTNYGYCLFFAGRYTQVVEQLQQVLIYDSNSSAVHHYLADAMAKTGNISQAVEHFKKAVELNPNRIDSMNELAWYLAVKRNAEFYDPTKAVKLATKACELSNYNRPEILDTLAAAYAAVGDYEKAVEIAQKAAELCGSEKLKPLEGQIESRIILYKNHTPYTEN
jgi:tetratricopeptide (TPR) repeat protein